MLTNSKSAINQVYNIAKGEQTSLNELFGILREISGMDIEPIHGPERNGDIKHSLADVSKAKQMLGYNPATSPADGLRNR